MTFAEYVKLCWAYLKASEQTQQEVLSCFTPEQAEVFLLGVGYFKIMVDKKYHDKIMQETLKKYVSEVLKDVDIKR